jgi:putative endopeptidase
VIAFAGAGGLGLPDRDYYVKTDAKSQETRARYLDHVAPCLAARRRSGVRARRAATVMAIETELAKASLTRVESATPTNSSTSCRAPGSMKLTPSFGLGGSTSTPSASRARRSERHRARVLPGSRNPAQDPPMADWKTYLRWHLAHDKRALPLGSAFVECEDFDFYSASTCAASPRSQPRWKRCVRYVDRDLGEALGQVFVAKTFTRTPRRAPWP